MPLSPGTRIAHYEIVAPLGAGGMGEVYRARDGRLNRAVAIKVRSSCSWTMTMAVTCSIRASHGCSRSRWMRRRSIR